MDTRPLKSRDRIMAMLDVEGVPAAEIAAFVGVHVNYVYTVQKSPLYQAQLEDLRERLFAKRVDRMSEIVDRLHDEAGTSLDKITQLRDNYDGKTPAAVQLGAASTILDRVVPRKQEQNDHTNNVVIISEAGIQRMAAVLSEAGIKPTQTLKPVALETYIEQAEEAEVL